MRDGCIVILTALDVEYAAIRARLISLRRQSHPAGTQFEVGALGELGGRVALALVGKGNQPAAVLTERAIAYFDPAAILFVGVAGALREHVALGDVVVATHIYAYHGGTSEDDGLMSRPRGWEVSHQADQIARHIARKASWSEELLVKDGTVPTVHFGPIAAGEVVHDSTISYEARWLREHYNDALAVEMEAAGVAQAGHLNNGCPVIVIRGISDRADGSKGVSDQARWQERAVTYAAAFAVALAGELAGQPQNDQDGGARGPERRAGMSRFTNVAQGNARVGVQAGQVFGDVRIGPVPEADADLSTQLADLRQQLRHAYRAGRIDESIHAAAEAELAVAAETLAAPSAQSRGKLIVALKRLQGLISDVADLATKVAAIIFAVRGIS